MKRPKPWDGYCPNCYAPEVNPSTPNTICIRGLKVYDADGTAWSQCLVCAGYYERRMVGTTITYFYDQTKGDASKGWFPTRG